MQPPMGIPGRRKGCWQPHDRGHYLCQARARASHSWGALQLLVLLLLFIVVPVPAGAAESNYITVPNTKGFPFGLPCQFPADRVTDLSRAIFVYWEFYDSYNSESVNISDSVIYKDRCYIRAAPHYGLVCNDTVNEDMRYFRCIAVFPPIDGNYQRTRGTWIWNLVETPPIITSMPRRVETIWLDSTVTVICEVQCAITPTIKLYIDGKLVMTGTNYSLQYQLTIDRRYDATCYAEALLQSGFYNATNSTSYLPYIPGATLLNEQCADYPTSGLCARHVGPSVAVQNRRYFNRTEYMLSVAFATLNQINLTESCSRELLERFLCNFYYVPCSLDSNALSFPFVPPCREYCTAVTKIMCGAEFTAIVEKFNKTMRQLDVVELLTTSEDHYAWWQPVVFYVAQQSVRSKNLSTSLLPVSREIAPNCSILNAGDPNRKRVPPPFNVDLFATCSRFNMSDFTQARLDDAGRPIYTDTCFYGRGAFYNGSANRTQIGECANWALLGGQTNDTLSSLTPYVFSELQQPHCRNPGGIFNRPICVRKRKGVFTIHECDIPQCITETTVSPQSTLTALSMDEDFNLSSNKRPVDQMTILEITSRPPTNETVLVAEIVQDSRLTIIIVSTIACSALVMLVLTGVLVYKYNKRKTRFKNAQANLVTRNGNAANQEPQNRPLPSRNISSNSAQEVRARVSPEATPSGMAVALSSAMTSPGYKEQFEMKRLPSILNSDAAKNPSHSRTGDDEDYDEDDLQSGSENGSGDDGDEYDEARTKSISSQGKTDPRARLMNKMQRNKAYHQLSSISSVRSKLRRLEFSRENTKCLEKIGVGAYGEVYKGLMVSENNTTPIALKALRPNCTREMQRDFEREALMLAELNHYNVVRILGICSVGLPFYILLEYMQNGDLNTFLRSRAPRVSAGASGDQLSVSASSIGFPHEGVLSRRLPLNDLATGESRSVALQLPHPNLSLIDLLAIARQIACGMTYISDRGFVHRDLATRNCLVNENLVVKIADFGLTRRLRPGTFYYHSKVQEAIATRWTPPESLIENVYTRQSDCWSFGVVLWEIFSYGQQPYENMTHEQVIAFVHNGGRLAPPSSAPESVCAMMRQCWLHNPYHRPSFKLLDTQLAELYMFYQRKKEQDDKRDLEHERELLAIQQLHEQERNRQYSSPISEHVYATARNLLEPHANNQRGMDRPNIVEDNDDDPDAKARKGNGSTSYYNAAAIANPSSHFTAVGGVPASASQANHVYFNVHEVAGMMSASNLPNSPAPQQQQQLSHPLAASNSQMSGPTVSGARSSLRPAEANMPVPPLPPKRPKPPPPLRADSVSSPSTPVHLAGQPQSPTLMTPAPTSSPLRVAINLQMPATAPQLQSSSSQFPITRPPAITPHSQPFASPTTLMPGSSSAQAPPSSYSPLRSISVVRPQPTNSPLNNPSAPLGRAISTARNPEPQPIGRDRLQQKPRASSTQVRAAVPANEPENSVGSRSGSQTWSLVDSEPGNELVHNSNDGCESISLEADVNRRLLSASTEQVEASDEETDIPITHRR